MENNEYIDKFGNFLLDKIEDYEVTLVADYKDFVYIDGEEGDYGLVYYSTKEGELVYTRHVHGGDRESLEFTELGKQKLKEIYLEVVNCVFE